MYCSPPWISSFAVSRTTRAGSRNLKWGGGGGGGGAKSYTGSHKGGGGGLGV